jgi:hypothetical protein
MPSLAPLRAVCRFDQYSRRRQIAGPPCTPCTPCCTCSRARHWQTPCSAAASSAHRTAPYPRREAGGGACGNEQGFCSRLLHVAHQHRIQTGNQFKKQHRELPPFTARISASCCPASTPPPRQCRLFPELRVTRQSPASPCRPAKAKTRRAHAPRFLWGYRPNFLMISLCSTCGRVIVSSPERVARGPAPHSPTFPAPSAASGL